MAAAPGLSEHLRARWQRLHSPRRVAGVDLARGLAVLGMFAAHLLVIESLDWADAATWLDVVNGRSSVLFATLAGVSIGLVTGRTAPFAGADMARARRRLAVRAVLIWVIGIALVATGVPVYVILPAYALLFLIALPLLRMPPVWLFSLAGVLALTMPFVQFVVEGWPVWSTPEGFLLDAAIGGHYPFTVWSVFVITGLGIARLRFTSRRHAGVLLVVGASMAALAYGFAATVNPLRENAPDGLFAFVTNGDGHSSGIADVLGSLGVAVAIIGLSVIVTTTPLTWAVLPLRAVGAMALTAYAAQIIVWAILQPQPGAGQSTLSAFRDLEPFWPFTIFTLILCTAWTLLIGRGPLEWAVDRTVRLAVRR